MAKKPPEPELHRWRITRIRAAPLGYVEAPDEAEAISEAIRRFGITGIENQRRLSATRMK
jgi:hypothetical protein